MYDVIIIGAGITGACIARELSRYDLNILVLEKNNDVSSETTKANSAIIHAGFDAKEGTLMAKLNVLGNSMFDNLSKELDFPFIRNGSLVIATDEKELSVIKELKERGERNGVPGLFLLSGKEAFELEPNINPNVKGALLAKTGAITGPWEMAVALLENAADNDVTIYTDEEVSDIKQKEKGFVVSTKKNKYQTKIIINCAGTYADSIHSMVDKNSYKIIVKKGEYFVLSKDEGSKFKHTIFQTPSELGKGILLAPTVHGNLLVGPDAENIDSKNDKSTSRERLELIKETSKKSSLNIDFINQIRQFSGLRADSDRNDFIVEESKNIPNFIDAAGIKSPGLSAAPAIALVVCDILSNKLILKEKKNFNPYRKKHIIFENLSYEEKNKLIKENPKYGHIICKCENITEGEIIDTIHRNIGAKTVDGVKRRCRPGMGACQGTFCGPKIQEILARELNKTLDEIMLDSVSSYILTEKTKGED